MGACQFFCVPKLVSWCAKIFDTSKITIQVGGNTILSISLMLLVFLKMPRFPNPNKDLKLPKADDFVTNHGCPKRLLPYFTLSLFGLKSNSFQFIINMIKEPFREFVWLFARVIDQESIAYFPRYVLIVLSRTFKMNWSFDWEHIFSI